MALETEPSGIGPETEASGIGPFDVFLSYNRADTEVVHRIARSLRDGGINPWLDTVYLPVGRAWQPELDAALAAVAAYAVFIGPSGLGNWEREELMVARNRAANEPQFRLIPVLLPGLGEPFDPSVLPPFLTTRTWVDLRKGIAGQASVQGLINAIMGVAPVDPVDDSTATFVCPYRGLQRFDEEDARFFYGRGGETQRLVEILKQVQFLAVIAPSGAGKSSLIRAGLIPALRRGDITSSDNWTIRVLRPGSQPLTSLAAALLDLQDGSATERHSSASAAMQSTIDGLRDDPRALHLAVEYLRPKQTELERVVWVIDQFEELFTLSRDDERALFIDNLVYAGSVPHGSSTVVLALRADFYARCAAYPELASYLATHQFIVSPMSSNDLRTAIEAPAWNVGLELERGLTEVILEDVESQPGALPLLEHALLELWHRRRGRMLTLEGYQDSGGVRGAIAKRAEAIYQDLPRSNQDVVRQVMLRLTQPGEGTDDTRRRATLTELLPVGSLHGSVEAVVNELVDARLLTTSADPRTNEERVEVSHEALIRAWPRLREWIDSDRAGLILHHRLSEAAQLWEELGRESGALYRGARLAAASEWRAAHPDAMSETEAAFLDASVELVQLEAEKEEARRRKELDDARRVAAARKRSTRLLALLAVVLLAGLVTSGVLTRAATTQRRIASSRELAVQAQLMLAEDPELSLLIAREAVRVKETTEALGILRRALIESNVRFTLRDHTSRVTSVAVDPSGDLLVTASEDETARVWDPHTGQVRAVLIGHEGPVRRVELSADGTMAATSGDDGTAQLWDVQSGERLHVLRGHAAGVRTASFSPDGATVVTASDDGTAALWRVADGSRAVVLEGHKTTVANAVFDSSGRRVVTASFDGTAAIWDANSGQQLHLLTEHRDRVRDAAFSPDGTIVATSSDDATVRGWDATTGAWRWTASGHTGWVPNVEFSPDGALLVSTGTDGTAQVWDASTGATAGPVLRGHTGVVAAASFTADSRRLVTASLDGTARVWDVAHPSVQDGRRPIRGDLVVALRGHTQAVVDAGFVGEGRYVVTASSDGTARIWDIFPGDPLLQLDHGATVEVAAFNRDGSRTVTAGVDGIARLWDPRTGTDVAVLAGHTGALSVATFNPAGDRVLTASADGTAGLWEASTGRQVASLPHATAVTAAAFSETGEELVTGDAAGNVQTWNAASGQLIAAFPGHTGPINAASFARGDEVLVTGSSDGTARVWTIASGDSTTFSHGHRVFVAKLDAGGGEMVTAGENSAPRLGTARTGGLRYVLSGHTGTVRDATFNHTGTRVATAGFDGTTRIFDVDSGTPLDVLRGHTGMVESVLFRSDDVEVLTASDDGTARVWDASTGELLAILRAQGRPLRSAMYSPDNERILTAGPLGTAWLFDCSLCAPTDTLVDLVPARVTRELTPQERSEILHK